MGLVPIKSSGVIGNNNLHDKRFSDILDYTFSNYDDHITIDNVAKIANLTKESFCRYFKSRARITYMEFLTAFRISKVCQMIRYDNQSIKEVGYAVDSTASRIFISGLRKS